MKLQRWAFGTGVGVLVLTALLHLVAALTGFPDPANDAEATLFRLLEGYEFEGVPMLSVGEVLQGLSLAFSVFLLGFSSLGLLALRGPHDSAGLRGQAVVFAGTSGILTAIGISRYPLPATLLLGTAFLAFVLSIASAGGPLAAGEA